MSEKDFKKLLKSYILYVSQLNVYNDAMRVLNANIYISKKRYESEKQRLSKRFKKDTAKHAERYERVLAALEKSFGAEFNARYHTETFVCELDRSDVIKNALRKNM